MGERIEFEERNLRYCDTISSSTASNSEIDFNQNSQLKNIQNDSLTLPPSNVSTNINSLALQSSSGVHFGNSVVYNGPVNIESRNIRAEESQKLNFRFFMNHKKILILSSLSFLLFVLLILVLAIKFDNSVNENSVSYPYELKIIKRNEWHAEKPLSVPELLDLPVDIILLDCTEMLECYSEEVCSETVRKIQQEHMTVKGFPDIGYNFVIGNNGLVYEGTGWDTQGSYSFVDKLAIAKGLNETLKANLYQKVLSITFIRNDCNELPNFDQKIASRFLIRNGMELGKLVDGNLMRILNLAKERNKIEDNLVFA